MVLDTGLSCLLKLYRYPIPDSRMFSLPIVIRFDVLKNPGFSDTSSHISFPVNKFNFQRVEKTLHRGIVITVGSASHAAAKTVTLNQSLISL